MEEMINDLISLGFTEYEARIYLAILEDYPTTGYQISKLAGIPRSMVYEALGRLENRGAVLKAEERRATLYRPVPPDQLLDRFQSEHQNRIEKVRASLNKRYQAQQEDLLWTIRGYGAVMNFVIQMIESAQEEIFLVLSDPELEVLRDALNNAHERQVQFNILLTGTGEVGFGRVARHPPLESQLQELDNTLIAVVDKQQVIIASIQGETTATVTKNRNLVMIAQQFVWMELFAQRVYASLGGELLDRLSEEDRKILEIYAIQ